MWPRIVAASEPEHRQDGTLLSDFRLRPCWVVCSSQVHPTWSVIVARQYCVVASGTGSLRRVSCADGSEVRHVPDPEAALVEDIGPARNGLLKRGRAFALPHLKRTE